MRFVKPVILVTLIGCGRIEFARTTEIDAPIDALDHTCDPTAPFGAPEMIASLDEPTELDGTLRLFADERTGYYWSRRAGSNSRLRYVARADLDAPFSVTDVVTSNPASQTLDPAPSPDGSFLVFRASGPGDDLYIAEIMSPGVLGTPKLITTIDSGAAQTQPFFASASELYFVSFRSGGGDLYHSTFTSGVFAAPAIVPELADPAGDGDPVVSTDGLTLMFRTERGGAGNFDIFTATRGAPGDPWSTPQPVPNVNSTGDDGPSYLSSDGCRMYISSDRAGTNDVYVATRGH